MSLEKKRATPVIDSRHLKVLAAKREDLRDSIVFICLNEEKYGHVEKAKLRSLIQQIDSLEPDGVYFPMLVNMGIEFYSRSEFRNRDLVVTIKHQNAEDVDTEIVEEEIRTAIPNARSIQFIHEDVEFGGLE
jgi:hypothetical protein